MKNWRKKDSLWLPRLGNEKGFITILTGGVPSAAYYPVGEDCALYHAYWDGTALDHSAYGCDGIVDGAEFVENGLHFDGLNDRVTVSSASNNIIKAGIAVDFSYFAWVKLDTDGASWDVILGVGTGVVVPTWALIQANPMTLVGYCYDPFLFGNTTEYNTGINRGNWIFVSYEIDRNVGGYLTAQTNVLWGPGGVLTDNAQIFNFPPGLTIGSRDTVHRLKGIIGEVYCFKSFNANYRTDIYNATKSRYGL